MSRRSDSPWLSLPATQTQAGHHMKSDPRLQKLVGSNQSSSIHCKKPRNRPFAIARFLGGAALVLVGVAATDAVVSSVARESEMRWLRRVRVDDRPLFSDMHPPLLDASRALLSAVLLRARPISGERIRAAERELQRALEGGDGGEGEGADAAARAADLRLLLALLAARDGRFDEALRRYGEVARDDPGDPRPQVLAYVLCGIAARPEEEAALWKPGFDRSIREAGGFTPQLQALLDELIVAAALGGAPRGIVQDSSRARSTGAVLRAAARRADVGLTAVLEDREMSAAKRLQVEAVREFFRAGVRSVLGKMEGAREDEPKRETKTTVSVRTKS